MNEEYLVTCLRSITKLHLSNTDINNIQNLFSLEEHVLDSIFTKNKIELVVLKHVEQNEKLSKTFSIRLRKKYSNHLFCLQFRYQEYIEYLKSLSKIFQKERIKHAVLKGFANIDLFTDNDIIYRDFSDLDILVDLTRVNDVHKTLNIMCFTQGKIINHNIIKASRPEIIYWKLNSHQLQEYTKFSKYSYLSSLFQLNIDINTTIFEGGKYADPISSQEILQHTMMRKINNELSIICLDYTYNLIQLCYHFFKDTIYKSKIENQENYCLRKFMDIREYVLKYKNLIDWNEFINSTKKSGISYKIYYPLKLVSLFYKDLGIDNILEELLDKNSDDILESDLNWSSMLL